MSHRLHLLDAKYGIPRFRAGMVMPCKEDREISAASRVRTYLGMEPIQCAEAALNLEEKLLYWQCRALNAEAQVEASETRAADLETVLEEIERGEAADSHGPVFPLCQVFAWGLIAGAALMLTYLRSKGYLPQ